MNNEQSIKEINEVIKKIEAALKPGCEIGARDAVTLRTLLQTNKVDRKAKFFECKRDHSEQVLNYFIKEKNIPKNKFSGNRQQFIYILL